MATRASMEFLIRHLRTILNDDRKSNLGTDQHYAGETIRFSNTYKDFAGTDAAVTSPLVNVYDSKGTLNVTDATPTATNGTGVYHYDLVSPAAGPFGTWRIQWSGTVDSAARKSASEFELFLFERVFTDEELQDFLDRSKEYHFRERLSYEVDQKIYQSRYTMLEGDWTTWDDDYKIIKIWDSKASGADAVTPDDSWNLLSGTFIFTTAQDRNIYLDCISYDIERAAALCMEAMASDPLKVRGWVESGGHSMTHIDIERMARMHWRGAKPKSVRITRTYR